MRDLAAIWKAYRPSADLPWNVERAMHLRRRAGFGPTWEELERDLSEGPETAIRRMLDGRSRLEGIPDEFERSSETLAQDANRLERLQAWWLFRMLSGPHPLQERLTLLWHQHFATANRKVDNVELMKEQNEQLRRYGMGPFAELVRSVVKHPAMLIWLDANRNRREHPNENLARELMELFTLGVGHYSERDVKEVARALTGWTARAGEFAFNPDFHDRGPKTVLETTDAFDGDQVVDLLLRQESTSHRLAWRLCQPFFADGVIADEARTSLAAGLREHGLDIRWGLETILQSQLFFESRNLRVQVREPAAWLVGIARSLELHRIPCSTLRMAELLREIGQELFNPPTVFGWKGGDQWVADALLINRIHVLQRLLDTSLCFPERPWSMPETWARDLAGTGPEKLAFRVSRLLLGRDPGDGLSSSDAGKEYERSVLQNILKQAEIHLG